MFLVILPIGNVIQNPIMSIAVQVIVGAIAYIGILLVLKDKFIYKMINNIMTKLKINMGV